jgi:hypothetical protein
LTATGTTTLAGASTSADITFGDNDKAIFGAGSDLQIYHDGSNSYVTEAGAGNLYIGGENHIFLTNSAGTQTYAAFNGPTGWAKLYYSNSEKLATTSTGVDINGTVTADDTITVNGTTAEITLNASGTTNGVTLSQTSTAGILINNASQPLQIKGQGGVGASQPIEFYTGNNVKRAEIAGANGDISFYEDTGTTAKFFWDASAESLGIGTTSPSFGIDSRVNNGSNPVWGYNIANIVDGQTNNSGLRIASNASTAGIANLISATNSAASQFAFWTYDGSNWGERVRIDSSGNVGIGTSSPATQASVQNASTSLGLEIDTTSGFASGPTLRGYYRAGSAYKPIAMTGSTVHFGINDVEKMRIDSSGNLLVGTTDASQAANTSGSGTVIGASGGLEVSRDSFSVAYFNKTSVADGNVIEIRKQGTTVGSIGSNGGNLFVASVDTGLQYNGVADQIRPCNGSGTARDAAIDLGDSTRRFKDLYLSGGVYLGGTGSANKLDDYEEGTWTPTFTSTGTDPTVTYGTRYASYRKVGSLVTIFIDMTISSYTGGTGNGTLGGLPFSQSGDARGVISGRSTNGITYSNGFQLEVIGAIAYFSEDASSDIPLSDFSTGGFRVIMGGSYTTA